MEYKIYLAFVFLLSVVRCNQYSGEDLNELFDSDSNLCLEKGSWSFSDASAITDKHKDISNILTPSKNLSCITSKPLSLISGGTLEVKVYAKSIASEDYLTVLVYESKDDDIVGQASLSEENALTEGWHVLKINLGGVGNYDGYIMLIGKSSSDSNLLVGSISYLPANEQKLLSKLTSQYQAPDIYSLETSSALLYKTYPKENTENQIGSDEVSLENRSFWIFDREDFWTPLTISLAIAIPLLIILVIVSCTCYALGKRKGAKQESAIVYEDFDNLPKPYLVPRVKSVYAESVTNSTFGGRNNNIFSV